MSGSPTNVNLNDTVPAPKPDAFNIEWQAGIAYPDPNVAGEWVRDTSACYRVPQVGGVYVIDDNTGVSPYDISATDSGRILVVNTTTAFTLSLSATAPFFQTQAEGVWNVTIVNIGTPTVTIDPNGLNLDGSGSTLPLEQFQALTISTDGTDYYSSVKASGFVGGVVANTGTSVTLGNTHHQKLLTTSNSSAVAVTLDSTVGKGFMAWHINLGAGTATLTPSSGTINGAANLAFTTNTGCSLFFDGTNWKAVKSAGGTPGGSSGDLQYNNSGAFGGFADGTSTQVLHGGRTFSAVDLAADVTGNLGTSHLASGSGASSVTFWCGDGTWTTPSGSGGSLSLPGLGATNGTPTTISDLLWWFAADHQSLLTGTYVGRWIDSSNLNAQADWVNGQSGSDRFVYTTSQINGLPAMVCTNSSYWAMLSQVMTTVTLFVVFKTTTVAAVQTFISGATNSLQLRINNTHLQVTKTGVANLATDSVTLSTGTWYQANITYDASSGAYAFRVNESAGASGTNTASITAHSYGFLYNASIGGEYFQGSLAEIILYNRVLNNTEIGDIETYLNGKYGI